jgi:hypothetical protein
MPIWQGFGRWGGIAASGGDPNADPFLGSVVLLMGFNGADGSTTMADESPSAKGNASVFGNAQLDTAQQKFGTASLLLDGVDDRITFSDSADGDFTVEAWIRFNDLTGFQTIVSHWSDNGSNAGWLLDYTGSATNDLRFGYTQDGNTVNAVFAGGDWTPSTGVWYHVAASRAGNTLRVFAGSAGSTTLIGSADVTGVTLANSGEGLRIGTIEASNGISEINDFNGWIDEIRITKGVGRYSSTFTVPTAAFPRS